MVYTQHNCNKLKKNKKNLRLSGQNLRQSNDFKLSLFYSIKEK